MVAHSYYPTYMKDEGRTVVVQGQPDLYIVTCLKKILFDIFLNLNVFLSGHPTGDHIGLWTCQLLSLPLKPSSALPSFFMFMQLYECFVGVLICFCLSKTDFTLFPWLTLSVHFSCLSLLYKEPSFLTLSPLYEDILVLSHCRNRLLGFCFVFTFCLVFSFYLLS